MSYPDIFLPVTNFRSELDPVVRKEFDQHNASLSGYLTQQHNDDGSHGDITAESIVTGPISVIADDNWISLYRANAAGNPILVGRLTLERQTYTPEWTAAGGDPAIGNGTIAGYYERNGRRVDVVITVVMGSTTTFGTGAWEFSLPTSAVIAGPDVALLMETGTGFYHGVATIFSATTIVILTGAAPMAGVDATTPFTWGDTDTVTLAFSYWD